MLPISRRPLGRTRVPLTTLGFGGAPLGDLFEEVPETQAQATLQAAWDAGVRYFDTAPYYGNGKSEHRLGHFLRQQRRDDFVLSTKVGRVFRANGPDKAPSFGRWQGGLPFVFHYDYSRQGILRSWEDSLQRLGLDRIDLLLVHDLDSMINGRRRAFDAHLNQLITSGQDALEQLKASGCIGGWGVGINGLGAIPHFLDVLNPDFFLVASPYTLLDQEVLELEFPRCQERGAHIVIGAVFASGILVTGADGPGRYRYAPPPPQIVEKTRRIEALCQRHDVPLGAAALQFPLGHPLVSAVIPGALHPEQVQANSALFHHPIPAALWADLKAAGLLQADAPTPA
ncbi:MAG: aldo/keto reductase [Candidatus Latescibacteria bacterium]|nr:aldo/keto reductase [Candidatus Latescibacterota bacterium]